MKTETSTDRCLPESDPDHDIFHPAMQPRRAAANQAVRAMPGSAPHPGSTPDHFVSRDGDEFAGMHVLLDLWGCERLGDREFIESAMCDAVRNANATLLHLHLHHFGPGCGVSGVALLAESHISVHTWPERGFAAFDVFMCGDAHPQLAVDVLRDRFAASRWVVREERRGLVSR